MSAQLEVSPLTKMSPPPDDSMGIVLNCKFSQLHSLSGSSLTKTNVFFYQMENNMSFGVWKHLLNYARIIAALRPAFF